MNSTGSPQDDRVQAQSAGFKQADCGSCLSTESRLQAGCVWLVFWYRERTSDRLTVAHVLVQRADFKQAVCGSCLGTESMLETECGSCLGTGSRLETG